MSSAIPKAWAALSNQPIDLLVLTPEFDRPYKLHQVWVWNSNQLIESFLGLGAKDITIELSLDGTDWTVLQDVPQLAQATGQPDYTANTIIDLGATLAQYVKITVKSAYGMMPQSGLSEVRFLQMPTYARGPEPANGEILAGVEAVLHWRAGREATAHEVYMGIDPDNLALAGTPATDTYAPSVLDYGTTYYWSVTEVNEAGSLPAFAGDIWRFNTAPFGIVDDFEQYNNDCGRIFFAWEDGLGHSGGADIEGCDVPPSNGNGGGSIVGHSQAPFAERTIVNAGSRQSMPFSYDNAFGPSEATLSLPGQDWTAHGIQTLSLAFSGAPGNTGTLYVKINNAKLVYEQDPADIAVEAWQVWDIDLSGIAGLQNVTTLTIGIDGASAAGMLYIDDIRLYPAR